MAFDLVLRGGRVIDPSQSIDRVTDVAFAGGRVAAIGDGLAADARSVEDAAGLIVTPGLIDLHTHVYWGGTSLGVDPLILARGGCTTLARHRQRRAGELSRLPGACDPSLAGADPRLSQRFLRRHLWLLEARSWWAKAAT